MENVQKPALPEINPKDDELYRKMTSERKNGNSGVHQFDESVGLRYILGEMSESEQERFEEAYFEDDAFFERFLAVKNELLDLYTRDELEPEIRTRMEQTFLKTSARRKRIDESRAFTRAITTIADRNALAASPVDTHAPLGKNVPSWHESIKGFFTGPRLAASVGIVILMLGAIWLFNMPNKSYMDLAIQSPQANSEQGNESDVLSLIPHDSNATLLPKNDVTHEESNTLLSQEGTGNFVVVPDRSRKLESKAPASTPKSSLIAQESPNDSVIILRKNSNQNVVVPNETESVTLEESTRSVTTRNTAEISPTTKNVRVRLVFSGQPYSSYSVRVATVEGVTVWETFKRRAALKTGPKSLSINVPANVLAGKDYIITLDGSTTDGQKETIREYYFHVERPK